MHATEMDAAVRIHNELIRSAIEPRKGIVLKDRLEGDSFFAVFARASNAVAAACDIHRRLFKAVWPEDIRIRVRIAIHTGEAHQELEDDYLGPVVNRCARLRGLAQGGQTVISSSVRELAQDALPSGVTLRDSGLIQLPDLNRPEHVFLVIDSELPVEYSGTVLKEEHGGVASPRRGDTIFISYRQRDSSSYCDRVYDRFRKEFRGNSVFRDTNDIPGGATWKGFIETKLRSSCVVVALIGRNWHKRGGRVAIHDPKDLVRRELQMAFALEIPVVPVIVGGARLPRRTQLPDELKRLLDIQALFLHDQDFERGLGRLVTELKPLIPPSQAPKKLRDSVRDPAALVIVLATAVATWLMGLAPWVAIGTALTVLTAWLILDNVVAHRLKLPSS